jgi:UDP-N-acetylmuramate dehydrogenase
VDIAVIRRICDDYGAEFLERVSIAPHTSFKIGGKCNIIKVNRIKVLLEVLKYCKKESVPYRILGRGSNVLVSDKGLNGVVLLLGHEFGEIGGIGDVIECMAGAKLSNICKAAAIHSLSGMEFAYGIPGTAGGALYMNAGAYDGEMVQIIESCEYLDEKLELKQIGVKDMKLSYRHSIFCEKDWIITKVRIRLKYGNKSEIKARMDEITAARREKQPLDFPSAGSVFKRPPPLVISESGGGGMPQGAPRFAAKLIDECGLKGKAIGGAQVSKKHAGFIINKGNATFNDVVNLIELIKEEVFNKAGVALECEVKIWE